MIIGISGKIGSGKDTVGRIIQYLMINKQADLNWSFKEFLDDVNNDIKNNRNPFNSNDFVIKKFADKLKDTVCLWTSCTREDLEDAKFKDSEIGENWNKWGVINNDPDNYEISYYISKEAAEQSITIDGDNWLAYKPEILEIRLTYRLLLQQLGTECMRNTIHPNGWVNSLMSEYKPITQEIKTSNIYNDNRVNHGYNKTRIFRIYHNIKQRCNNKKHPRFKDYGLKGIKLCKEWEDSLENFINWSENNGYNELLTIDRKDNDKGYSPENCRWVGYGTQAINQGIRKDNTSGFKGVCKEKGKWRADTQINKKRIFLGYFNTPEEASEAYEQAFLEKEKLYESQENNSIVYPNFIVTDTRFPNELEAIKKRGGISILIQRPCKECGITVSHSHICSKKNEALHSSETALDNSEFDYYIANDSTLEELIEKVKEILIKENII